MKEQIVIKLQNMLNKPLRYGIKVIYLTGYEMNDEKERVYIHSSEKSNHFDRPYDSALALLKGFEPAEAGEVKGSGTALIASKTTNIVSNLRSILLENIEKVRADKAYIPQATAINNNVNSIINLSKLEMDALKMAERLNNF